MVIFPLYIIGFIYLAFLAVFAVFAFVNIMHIIQTGTFTRMSFLITLFVMAFTALILYATWYFLKDTDWQQTLFVWNTEGIKNLFSAPTTNF